jgi:hypothetical protein
MTDSTHSEQVITALATEIDRLHGVVFERDAEIARLRTALEYYADPENYTVQPCGPNRAAVHLKTGYVAVPAMTDAGERARAALKESK